MLRPFIKPHIHRKYGSSSMQCKLIFPRGFQETVRIYRNDKKKFRFSDA